MIFVILFVFILEWIYVVQQLLKWFELRLTCGSYDKEIFVGDLLTDFHGD